MSSAIIFTEFCIMAQALAAVWFGVLNAHGMHLDRDTQTSGRDANSCDLPKCEPICESQEYAICYDHVAKVHCKVSILPSGTAMTKVFEVQDVYEQKLM